MVHTLITSINLMAMKCYKNEQANRWIRRQAFHHSIIRSYRDMYPSSSRHWTRNVNLVDKIRGANLFDVGRVIHTRCRTTYRSRKTKGSASTYCLSNQSIFSYIFLRSLNVVVFTLPVIKFLDISTGYDVDTTV